MLLVNGINKRTEFDGEKEQKESDRYEIKVAFHVLIFLIFTLKRLSAIRIRIIIMKIYQYFQICFIKVVSVNFMFILFFLIVKAFSHFSFKVAALIMYNVTIL